MKNFIVMMIRFVFLNSVYFQNTEDDNSLSTHERYSLLVYQYQILVEKFSNYPQLLYIKFTHPPFIESSIEKTVFDNFQNTGIRAENYENIVCLGLMRYDYHLNLGVKICFPLFDNCFYKGFFNNVFHNHLEKNILAT